MRARARDSDVEVITEAQLDELIESHMHAHYEAEGDIQRQEFLAFCELKWLRAAIGRLQETWDTLER